ncbi:MAG TPA: CotH kinase family protein [Solirubrobacterales bacterium]
MEARGFDTGRGGRFLIWAAFCLAFSCAAEAARAEPAPGEAAPIYDPGTVSVIDIGLSPEAIDELEEDPDEYVKGTFTLTFTDGTPGSEEGTIELANDIGVRLKGGTGSFRPLTEKAAFKLKFNEYAKQRVLGLKKMTLNNMVQDPSKLHETLAYTAFRAAGVPASRTGYADVRVNGEDFGLYLNVETLDDVGLERWFGEFDDPQHLYEGEYATDVTPGGASAFSVDEGDEDVRTDLEALIAAVAGGGSAFSERVDGLMDLDEMTRMWAVEKYIGHWDGYAGAGPSLLPGNELPNNFYLFSNAAGRFQMLPWGTDQTWSKHLDFGAEAGLLFDECLAEPACRDLHRESLALVGSEIDALDLDSLAEATAVLLEPWEELGGAREEHSPREIGLGVADARAFIAERPAELEDWLDSEPTSTPSPRPAPAASAADSLPQSPRALRVGRAVVVGGVLVTRLSLPAAGTLGKRVTIRTRTGSLAACKTRVRSEGAGPAVIRCKLSADARKRIAARWLRLRVELEFAADAGSRESRVFDVLAPRASD